MAPISGPKIAELMAKLYASPKNIVMAARRAQESDDKTNVSKAVIPIETVKGKITKITGGGRSDLFAAGKLKRSIAVSGRRTKVTIGGAKVKRKALKVGMS